MKLKKPVGMGGKAFCTGEANLSRIENNNKTKEGTHKINKRREKNLRPMCCYLKLHP